MQVNTIVGITSTEQPEKVWLTGYNGSGGDLSQGTPVCWDAVASDGRTLDVPTQTGFNNFGLVAGIAEDTVTSGDYTSRIVAYGPCEARTYGIATTFIPGAGLVPIADKTYLHYGTVGQVNGTIGGTHPAVSFIALETNATVDTNLTTVFVRCL